MAATSPPTMRTPRDRIRHAILFEIIALILVAPLGGIVFGVDMAHFGVVAAVSTTVAMGWNYVYNLGFDHALVALGQPLNKTALTRIVHAVLFEGGLLLLLVPFIAWYLAVPLWEAFVMDLGLAAFYLAFALVFNWAYDRMYPLA